MFVACVAGVTVEAEVVSVDDAAAAAATAADDSRPRHDVMLYDSSDESRVAINHLLLYQGHARSNSDDADVIVGETAQRGETLLSYIFDVCFVVIRSESALSTIMWLLFGLCLSTDSLKTAITGAHSEVL